MLNKVIISLGSNQGNRYKYICESIKKINLSIGNVLKASDIYEAESWSYNDNDYLNLVLEIKTLYTPKELLEKTKRIEKELGRSLKTEIINEKAIYKARTIDIDILFYNSEIIEIKNLTIPHSKLHLRNFVLKPLNQIAPNLIHPILNKKINDIYIRCEDKSFVKLYKKIKIEDIIQS